MPKNPGTNATIPAKLPVKNNSKTGIHILTRTAINQGDFEVKVPQIDPAAKTIIIVIPASSQFGRESIQAITSPSINAIKMAIMNLPFIQKILNIS